jgi:hypothetical protein
MMITRRRLLTSSALLAGGALLTSPFTSRRGHAADSYPRRVVIFIEGNGIRPECVMDPLTRQTLESIAGKPIASNRDYGHADPVITAKAPLDQARSLGALAAQGQELSLVEPGRRRDRLHPVQLQLVRVRQGQAGADPPPALGGLLYLLRRRRLGRRRRVLPDAQALPRVRPRGRRPRAQGLQRLLQGPHQALRLP